MTCNCPGNICTCSGIPRLKDSLDERITFHMPLMLKDSAMATPSISEKREAVAKAYGEAAVKKLAEAGAKSADYKAAYARRSGELFVGGRDDRFIEGFYESLQAGRSPEEAEQLLASETGRHPTDSATTITADTMPSATMTLDEAMKLPRYAGMWPSQAQQYAARDLAMAKAGHRASPEYQHGVRDAYAERLGSAWAGGENVNRPATDAATAHDQLRRDLSEAWKH